MLSGILNSSHSLTIYHKVDLQLTSFGWLYPVVGTGFHLITHFSNKAETFVHDSDMLKKVGLTSKMQKKKT